MPLVWLHAPELIRIFMTASSSTARLLSLAVLLLSLAPLGSLYVLLFSLGLFGTTDTHPNNDTFASSSSSSSSWQEQTQPQPATTSSLAHVLSNPNATLEELWTALFLERWNFHPHENYQHQYHHDLNNPFVLAFLPIPVQTAHHMHMMLPWLLSLLLGVILPAGLSMYSFWLQRQRLHTARRRHRRHGGRHHPRGQLEDDDEEQEEEDDDDDEDGYFWEMAERARERRKDRVLKLLHHYTKTLTVDDLAVTAATAQEFATTTRVKTEQKVNSSSFSSADLLVEENVANQTKKEPENDEDHDMPASLWRLPRPGVSVAVGIHWDIQQSLLEASSSIATSHGMDKRRPLQNNDNHDNHQGQDKARQGIEEQDEEDWQNHHFHHQQHQQQDEDDDEVDNNDRFEELATTAVLASAIAAQEISRLQDDMAAMLQRVHSRMGTTSSTIRRRRQQQQQRQDPKQKLQPRQREPSEAAIWRTVVGTCAVCLNHYRAGERVTWSPNVHCSHVFHESCIMAWMFRTTGKASQRKCPCCRQNFTRRAQQQQELSTEQEVHNETSSAAAAAATAVM